MHPRFRRLLIAAVAAAPFAMAGAQSTGSIRGRVTEASGQRPIADVQVLVVGTGSGALTNANGEFTIVNAPVGERTLRVRRIGFVPLERTVTVTSGETTRLELSLAQSLTQLEQLVITGTPGLTEKRTLGNSITTVDVADLNEKTTVLNVSEVLQSKTPGRDACLAAPALPEQRASFVFVARARSAATVPSCSSTVFAITSTTWATSPRLVRGSPVSLSHHRLRQRSISSALTTSSRLK